MSDNVIKLPESSDTWQFTVEVVRSSDGQLVALLVAARDSLIEQGDTQSHLKLHEIANMLEEAIGPMRANAESLKPLDETGAQ